MIGHFTNAWKGVLITGLLLAAAVGCTKVHEPRVGDPEPAAARPAASAAGTTSRDNTSETIEKACSEMAGSIPDGKLEQYKNLRALLGSLDHRISPEKFDAAHTRGLAHTLRDVTRFLRKKRMITQARRLEAQVHARINFATPKPDEDLATVLTLMNSPEGSSCANAFLLLFYFNFTRELDHFSSLTFEPAEGSPVDGTVAESPLLLPNGEWAGSGIEERGEVIVASLRRWETGEKLDSLIEGLKTRFAAGAGGHEVVLDLRSAAGEDTRVLDRLRAATADGWGNVPLVIWIDAQTRGTPEVFAAELAVKPNVLVIGNRSLGYARKICRQSAVLAEGTGPIRVTFGCDPIPVLAGTSPDGAGVGPAFELAPTDDSRKEASRLLEHDIPPRLDDVNHPAVTVSPDALRPDRIRALLVPGRAGGVDDAVLIAKEWAAEVPAVH